jgi:hypothetical protein
MKVISYTAISGSKDKLRDDILVFSEFSKFKSPVMNAKVPKLLPHKYLDCDVSIWVDGNIFLLKEPQFYVDRWLRDADMAIFVHNHAFTIYKEERYLESMFKNRTPWVKLEIKKQLEYYRSIGIPEDTKMYMGGFIIRRHTKEVERFNEAWFAEVCRWSQRDQLSLPVILRQFPELKINYIGGNIKKHRFLRYEEHAHFNT